MIDGHLSLQSGIHGGGGGAVTAVVVIGVTFRRHISEKGGEGSTSSVSAMCFSVSLL